MDPATNLRNDEARYACDSALLLLSSITLCDLPPPLGSIPTAPVLSAWVRISNTVQTLPGSDDLDEPSISVERILAKNLR